MSYVIQRPPFFLGTRSCKDIVPLQTFVGRGARAMPETKTDEPAQCPTRRSIVGYC